MNMKEFKNDKIHFKIDINDIYIGIVVIHLPSFFYKNSFGKA